jgi:hypothetical protein
LFLLKTAVAILAASYANAQVTGLSFRPIDAKYSSVLDRLILISANPNQLHIYNPSAFTEQTVALSAAPTNISLSPDGTRVAVASATTVFYIDLQTAQISKTFAGLSIANQQVIVGNGYIYAFPRNNNGSASVAAILSIEISTGNVTAANTDYASGGIFDPLTSAVYTTQDRFSPELLYHYNAKGAISKIGTPTMSSFSGTPFVCGPLSLSPDGSIIYSGCGTVFNASTNPAIDMSYAGSIPGLVSTDKSATIQAIDVSGVLRQLAAIPVATTANPAADTVVNLFDTSTLNAFAQLATTPFSGYAAHARWAFYNSASTVLYLITQADSTAKLSLDYALETVTLSNPNSCNATFSASNLSAPSTGGYLTAQIESGQHCLFTAVSNTPWLVLSSGYRGSGNTTLTVLARPNLSATPRSGSISMGGQTVTVSQAAAVVTPPNPLPLSFKPVAAEYNKTLDRVIFVSASPNELHIFDPISQSDQIIPLSFIPLSLSVTPDGAHAAVGHSARLSYIDIAARSVSWTISLPFDVSAVSLPANGYAYAFSTLQDNTGYSVQLTNQVIGKFGSYPGTTARALPNGSALYVAQGFPTDFIERLDITTNPASPATTKAEQLAPSMWLTEDGAHLLSSFGTLYRTSSNRSLDLTTDGSLSVTTNVAGDAPNPNGPYGTQLQLYDETGATLKGQLPLPSFNRNGKDYVAHGRYVFWNADSTKLFAFTQADSTSGILSDFALFTVSSPSSIPACSAQVSPTTLNFAPKPAVGFQYFWPVVVNVTSNCSWTASGSTDWLSYQTVGGLVPPIASGQLQLFPSVNTGAARSTTLTVANSTVTINQSASTCSYSLSSKSQTFPVTGGTGSFNINTQPGCLWSAVSSDPWLTVTSPASGQGSGTVSFTAAPSSPPSGYQFANLVIAGTLTFAVFEQQSTSPPLTFVTVTPCRVADTRNPNGPFGGPVLSANTTRTLLIPQSACNIPAWAAAYSLNVTAVPRNSLGYLTVWPTGANQPTVSLLNSDGRVKAVASITPAGTNGGVNFFATDTTDLVVDISGYFDQFNNSGLSFYLLNPCRLVDTRNPSGPLAGPALTATQTRAFPLLTSACGIPSDAKAYSLNFTAVPNNGIGYLSTWPAGQSQPLVSTLNDPTATVVANAAIVPVGANGGINTYSSDATHLVVDANGYFATPTTGTFATAQRLYTVDPCRIFDTRLTSGAKPLNGAKTIPIVGNCNIPSGATAVVMNATVVPIDPLGYLSLWPSGTAQPLVSTLNANDKAVTSNMAIVPLANGAVDAFTTSASHLILDVTGYFAP